MTQQIFLSVLKLKKYKRSPRYEELHLKSTVLTEVLVSQGVSVYNVR